MAHNFYASCFIGRKSLYWIHCRRLWRGFLAYISPNLNRCGLNLEYKSGVMVCTHRKKTTGLIARGVAPKDAKTCFSLFLTNTAGTFGHLSCTDFDHFWNKWRELVCACVSRWKIYEFLRMEFYRSQKQLKWVLLRGCLWQEYCSNGTTSGNGSHFGD